ncbi:mechanosensitive ion channel family protein [Robertkochia aurantiaca]|uniref:mechanosensitive ion channel family protein n=1 Tax=Robertkochia aurantiaca TaxID=2873700 RepID=UPI001CCD87D7|nr:mechanosensitive ion channel domain-containing protein [Robertkochia sp. 3YJGBD-33]
MEVNNWMETAIDAVIFYGPKILLALAIWIIGSWVVKRLVKTLDKVLSKKDYDPSLSKFLLNLLKWGLTVLLILVVLGTLGVETTSFAALIAAAGLGVGLALQGSLANVAGGALIMIFKPFEVGDLIEAQGELGTVEEVQIFNTILVSPENKTIVIPNGPLSNGNIINYTKKGTLRIDLVIGVAYASDLKRTREVMLEAVQNQPGTLKEPAPTVAVSELADSSVNFVVRPWTEAKDYWGVRFACIEAIKEALDKAGIEIPYPHQVEIRKKG